jgi:flagellar basal-body rod protein FlgG
MMKSLWIAKTGLTAQQTQLDVISNNLANVGTSGFKRSRAVFEDLMYQTTRAAGAQTSQQTQVAAGMQVGTGVRVVATERLFTTGGMQKTDDPYQVAINGSGFLQVLLPDGTTGYTRDGSLKTNAEGQLVTQSGYPIQPPVTIPTNATDIGIGVDGIVTVQQPGSAARVQVGTMQLAMFPNPTGLEARGENLYLETPSSGAPNPVAPGTLGAGELKQGYVETSNVNVVEELVNMIQTQRAYEINSKAINAADQMLQRLGQL